MQPLDEQLLRAIATHLDVQYNIGSLLPNEPMAIKTEMARKFNVGQQSLYTMIADLKDHTRLFSHLTAINVIVPADVAGVIGINQRIIVEGLAEGGSKLGVKLVTLNEPNTIECELYTDLFDSAFRTVRADRKKGDIVWSFEPVASNECVMRIKSRFEVAETTAYIQGSVDHVWLDFFENVMIDLGELRTEEKRCAPFPVKKAVAAE